MINLKEITLDINGKDVKIPADDVNELKRILVLLSYIDPDEDINMEALEGEPDYPVYLSWLNEHTDVLKPIVTRKDRGNELWAFDGLEE